MLDGYIIQYTPANFPYIRKGKKRKYLHEHTCYSCEQTFLAISRGKIIHCPTCKKDPRIVYASLQVKTQRHRAEKVHLPATLTVQQWLEILEDFDWHCAYCFAKPKRCYLEHYIPICLGGGTIASNVLPTCPRCNSLKLNRHPEHVFPWEVIEFLAPYLKEKKETNQ